MTIDVIIEIDANLLSTGSPSIHWYAPTSLPILSISIQSEGKSYKSPIPPESTINFKVVSEGGTEPYPNFNIVHIVPVSSKLMPFVNINFNDTASNPFQTKSCNEITFEEVYDLYCEYTVGDQPEFYLLDPKLQYAQKPH